MGQWHKASVAFVMATAIATVTLSLHHSPAITHLGGAHVNSADATTDAAADPTATPDPAPNPPPSPLGQAPVAPVTPAAPPVSPRDPQPSYDAGAFTDVDPKPASYELRAWAILNRRTGKMTGSPNSAVARNSTESMIKAWIASDYLRRLGDEQPSKLRLRQIRGMIRDSDDEDAQSVYVAGGRDAVT
jgi:hypothetical protein